MTDTKRNELTVRFCGIAGDGVVSSGRILAGACAGVGLDVMVNDIYSAEIRGLGKSTTTVRFAAKKVQSMGDGIDVLVGMAAKESISEVGDVVPGGLVIYDNGALGKVTAENSLPAHIPPTLDGYGVPLKKLANAASGTDMGKNLVAMGALCFFYTLPKDMFLQQIKRVFGRKGEEVLTTNNKAFNLGYEYCEEHYPLNRSFELQEGRPVRNMISGNDAITKGALDCGLKLFCGYPITPATKIMEIAAKELPKLGGWCHQSEDEIAAISGVLGGFFAGKRSMTSTSGPGLALMSEMLGLSAMAEIAAVIVNVQRGGPSTGLPTKAEQGDLNIALYGGAGDCPRVVMAPSNAEECYNGIQLAFDLAEKYQTPVIFLSDLFLSQRIETATIAENIQRDRCTRIKPTAEELEGYERFSITETGVSPQVVPGEPGAFYTVTGLEHTPKGKPGYEAELHTAMTEKRFRKFFRNGIEMNP
ncbi:MAG: 2-oxoacid:acceptor oxidoreductase subunit alpha, partial [bacterium]|nr:2-oxoacid:acceptor oxidoreductase subunit alpha [bacterium]